MKLNDIINQADNELAKLLNKVQQLNWLTQRVREHLPLELRAHCQVANCSNNVLSLVVENGAWATQLRYRSAELLAQLRKDPSGAGIKAIQVLIDPSRTMNLAKPTSHLAKPNKLSISDKQVIANTAKSIQDPQLKQALKSLAR